MQLSNCYRNCQDDYSFFLCTFSKGRGYPLTSFLTLPSYLWSGDDFSSEKMGVFFTLCSICCNCTYNICSLHSSKNGSCGVCILPACVHDTLLYLLFDSSHCS